MKMRKLKFIQPFFVVVLILINHLGFSQEKVLQSSRLLAEAEFHFDTFYKIVDCGSGLPQIHITSFNESGRDLVIAFDIQLKDNKSGKIQDIKVPFFSIKAAELMAPNCSESKNNHLKYALENQIDYRDMSVTVKFSTK